MNRADKKRNFLAGVFQQAASRSVLHFVPVKDVMTLAPCSVSPQTSARELLDLFQARRFRHFFVVEQQQLVGVISDRDVIHLFGAHDALEADYLDRVYASELMSTDLVTTTPDAPFMEAVGKIVNNGISCLPVVENGEAVGILTSTDLYLALEQLLVSIVPQLESAHA